MTATNFKDLWQSQNTTAIPSQEIIAKANKLKATVRKRTIIGNAVLFLTAVFITAIMYFFKPELLVTKIGALLIIAAIVMQIAASSRLLPIAKETQAVQSTSEYLAQLLQIRKKQAFLQTTVLSIYFILLSLGLFLYMIEYAMRMSRTAAIIYYIITALWIGIAWFLLRPRTIRKQNRNLDATIQTLEEVNKQFSENEL